MLFSAAATASHASVHTAHVGRTAAQRTTPCVDDLVLSERQAPTHRLNLAHLPTPIEPWNVPCPQNVRAKISIKRDDYTGLELTGNKARF